MATPSKTARARDRFHAVFTSVDWPVALLAAAAAAGLGAGLLLDFEEVADRLSEIKLWLSGTLKFLFLAAPTGALAICLWLALGRTAHLRLGNVDEPPAFRMPSWLGMMLGAGMAMGLVIWSIAEPLHHLVANPLTGEEQQQTAAASSAALRLTMLHWGLHPWALYALTGVAFAYAGHRLGRPFRPSSVMACAVGNKAAHHWGPLVDLPVLVVAVLAVVSSLAFVAAQIETAAAALFQFETTASQVRTAAELAREAAANQNITDPGRIAAMIEARTPFRIQPILAIGGVVLGALLVLMLGLVRGVRPLGFVLLFLGALFLAFLVLFGPTTYALEGLSQALGDYFAHFIPLGLWTNVNDTQSEWQLWWTVYYWGWWLALALPVGLFIGIISRGRTVRQMMLGGLVAPAGAALVWIGIVGSVTLHTELFGDGGLTDIVKDNAVRAAVAMLESLRLALFDAPAPELQPFGALLLSILLILASIAFLAAGVIAIERTAAFKPSPGTLARRFVWALLVAGGAAAMWAWGGEHAVQSLRDAAFIGGAAALLLLSAAVAVTVAALRREAAGETPAPLWLRRRERPVPTQSED